MSQAARRYLAPLAILALGAGAGWRLRANRPLGAPPPIGLAQMPLDFGGFHGRELPTDKSIFAYLGADEMVDRLYVDQADQRSVKLSIVYARGWRALHSPQACFKNQGWRLIQRGPVDLDSAGGQPIHAAQMIMDTSDERIVTVYTFATSSATTGSWVRHSFRMAVAQGARGGALIVAVSPSPSAAGDEASRRAAAQVAQEAHTFLMKKWGEQKE